MPPPSRSNLSFGRFREQSRLINFNIRLIDSFGRVFCFIIVQAYSKLIAALINGIAMMTFIVSGIVLWNYALLIALGTVTGGYFGARYIRKLPTRPVRGFVVIYAALTTLYFFIRTYA